MLQKPRSNDGGKINIEKEEDKVHEKRLCRGLSNLSMEEEARLQKKHSQVE